MQPAEEGDCLAGRGGHSATRCGSQVVIFGGSSNFSTELMQCTKFYNDVYTISAGKHKVGSFSLFPCSSAQCISLDYPLSQVPVHIVE